MAFIFLLSIYLAKNGVNTCESNKNHIPLIIIVLVWVNAPLRECLGGAVYNNYINQAYNCSYFYNNVTKIQWHKNSINYHEDVPL